MKQQTYMDRLDSKETQDDTNPLSMPTYRPTCSSSSLHGIWGFFDQQVQEISSRKTPSTSAFVEVDRPH